MKYKVYGSPKPGSHPKEAAEMATFFNSLKKQCPELHKVALHIRNEGKRSGRQMQWQKAQGGFVKGASDIVIPGNPTFVCELKSCSKSSRVSDDQEEYLNSCAKLGCFAVLAYGWESAWQAVKDWEALL